MPTASETRAIACSAVKPFFTSWRMRSQPLSMPNRSSTQPVEAIASIISRSVRSTRPKDFHITFRPERLSASQNSMTRDFFETKYSS